MNELAKVNINGKEYHLKDETARQGSGGNVDLTGYATEQWVKDQNYLTKVPEGYAKTTDIPTKPEDIGAQPAGNYLTEVPSGYASEEFVRNKIAEAELGDKEVDLSGYAQKSELPTKVSQLYNDSGYLQHQDITGLLPRAELTDAINTALAQAKASGEFKGDPGYTPEKNVDYFDGDDYVLTAADKEEIAELAAGLVEVPNVVCTPEMFGAVGNGTTDDTEVIRSCINYANEKGLEVKFSKGKKYKVNQKTPIVAHCSIDFNGSIIILSGGSIKPFIKLEPLARNTYTLTENSLTEYTVKDEMLFNKCMTIVSPINLGVRNHEAGGDMPFKQTLKTDMNGNFINEKLECKVISGSYTINNVHDYIIQRLEIKNVTVDYSEIPDDDTAVFIESYRSNVKFDNINIVGTMIINKWSHAVLGIYNSCNIEISNIRGNSPYSSSSGTASGYVVGLYEVADVYMHDCDFGGSATQWGCIGVSYISNFVAERVNTNRFDCHYYFTGYFTVRDCTTNLALFCGGNGEMTYERVTFISLKNDTHVRRRADLDVMPSGIVKFSECTFEGGDGVFNWSCPPAKTDLLTDIKYDFTHFIFENCKVHSSWKFATFEVSTGWDNISVDIINTNTGWRILYNEGESKIKKAIIRGCTFSSRADISGCDELIIKECRGNTVYVENTNNSCILCDNIFTPTNTTLIRAYAAIIANNVILADFALVNEATKYIIANNLPLYDTSKSSWANVSK